MWRRLGLPRRAPTTVIAYSSSSRAASTTTTKTTTTARGRRLRQAPEPATGSRKRQQTLVERIAQRHALGLAPGQRVRQGDCISIRPRHVLTHDNSWAVMAKFAGLLPPDRNGLGGVANPRQPVLALDHNVQDKSEGTLARYAAIERFARQHGLDFYPAGRGIGHQVNKGQGMWAVECETNQPIIYSQSSMYTHATTTIPGDD